MAEFAARISSGIVFFPFEMVSAVLVFSWPLKKRSRFWLRLVLGLAGAAVLVLSGSAGTSGNALPAGLLSRELSVQVFAVTTFWCGALFAVCALLSWFLFEVRLREALYCAACAYLMEHLAYCARILCGLLSSSGSVTAGTPEYYLICAAVYAAVYQVFARRLIQDGKLAATAQESLLLTLVTLSLVMAMSIAASVYQFETAHAVYASFCCISVLYGQLKQQKQIKYQSELALQQQMWSLHKTQYEMSRESIEIINRKCHDLKHQVAALKYISDPERKNEVIDSLQSSVMIYDSVAETGNEILDTVLTEKSLICGKHEIALSCIADGKQLAFLDPVDLYTLVGNALDNAIEAVLPLSAPERLIRIRVQKKAGLVFLRIENPYSGSLTLRDGLPVTHKEDRQNHGFGLKSIRDIVEKYHGLFN
ncbi:MAG: GHKL domain-containing protein, partial [Candidatus Onthomonas sp.]